MTTPDAMLSAFASDFNKKAFVDYRRLLDHAELLVEHAPMSLPTILQCVASCLGSLHDPYGEDIVEKLRKRLREMSSICREGQAPPGGYQDFLTAVTKEIQTALAATEK